MAIIVVKLQFFGQAIHMKSSTFIPIDIEKEDFGHDLQSDTV